MTRLTRRSFGLSALALAALAGAPLRAETVSTLKIGYQKTNLPVIAQRQRSLETALAPLGVTVDWVQFAAGPPLVEALNVGAIQLGWTGDAPPIFGQSSGAAISYVAALPPNGAGEAIIARPDSGIATLADLRGRKVAVGKGTSAQNLLIAALEAHGLAFRDVEPVFLGPADAAAAFGSGAVDAWSIWDPFLAIAEVTHKPVVLIRAPEVLRVNTWFLANRDFAAEATNTPVIEAVLAALKAAASWADSHRAEVAQALHEVTGVPIAAQTLAADRAQFGIFEITPEILAAQQDTADRFFRLGLIPTAITVSDALWTPAKG
ncbi:aliphatic sulfonate ABC transporter substrate-binding protein [Rhodobacter capsulatus]|uniref:Putative aliphatic sulfonates-binding protein n=1 Tax=Rhodobacter capsulatus TaxID=1061 RepID=A0A4U1JTB3_RHOCA|nr:aliphatic sulfonate ABC transporter substrate-binding protein [Rhodobacter capsulatus]TKD21705.1 aliphatic sulfonate ABC transporter substrate-binding protein [Rhodobacter capsulatus]